MSASENEVLISYGWGGESERIVNEIDEALRQKGIRLIRDKHDLGFKGSIREFMERIGRGNCVIVVISDKYLRSENCMFELLEVAKNQQLLDRIFPIVLQDADIYKPLNRIKYIKHWEDQIAELNEAIKTVNAANLQGITDDINLYVEIRTHVARLIDYLRDMNTLTPEMHKNTNFSQLIEALEERIKETPIPEETIRKPGSGLKRPPAWADGIPPIQVHGYSGRWEVDNSFSRWRGYELGANDLVYFHGTTFLLLSVNGEKGSGTQTGKLYVSIDNYKAAYEIANWVYRATVTKDGILHMDVKVLSRTRIDEEGVPREARFREELFGSGAFRLDLYPVPGESKRLTGKHTYSVANRVYQEAKEDYEYFGF